MRQDLRQRQRQIRKLHESIQKYQQSPNTKKAVQKATLQLANAIEYKFRKSEANRFYVFPRFHQDQPSDDQYDLQPEIVDLKVNSEFMSHQLSIAEQPESNLVYISEKTVLMQQRCSPLSKYRPDIKSKPKIKVFKKKNFQTTCQTIQKLDRLRTQHIQANFSTISYKNQSNSKSLKKQTSASKSRSQLNSQCSNIRKKLKIASKMDTQHLNSPVYANITVKTQYTHSNCLKSVKRKQGKQNERIPHHTYENQKYFISQNSTKKMQGHNNCSTNTNSTNTNQKNTSTINIQNLFKPHINVKFPVKKNNKQNQLGETTVISNNHNTNSSIANYNKKSRVTYKSFQNLKSIRLGSNRSTQKVKMVKALYA